MSTKAPKLPPRWVMRTFWRAHRRVYVLTGGRRGLRVPKNGQWGTMRLTTVGRRTGELRPVMLAYLEDGANLFTMAMNGVAPHDPAWLLNLRSQPEGMADLADAEGRPWRVRAREAEGEERERLWARWRQIDANLDGYAALRPGRTALVVLERC